MGTFTNSVDPDEWCGISLGSTLFGKVKMRFRQKNTIVFKNYSLTPLDILYTMDHPKFTVSNQKEK